MSKVSKFAVLSVSAAIVLFTVAGGLGVRASSNDGAYRQLGVLSEVLSRIRTDYVEEPQMPLVTDGALHGLVESLDASSSYLNPAEYKAYKERKPTGKANIGAALSKRFGYAAVVAVLPNSPAAKAGLEGGDIVEAIDGRSTRELSLAEIKTILEGQPGSTLNLTVIRARRIEPQKLTITRENIVPPPVAEKMVESGIGYVKAESLAKGKAQEIGQRIKQVQNAGARKLILDLRDTADGDEQEGIAVANLFLNRGTITYLQGQTVPRQTFTADPARAVTSLPLVVLVNRGTAGAAEIVAASLLENARADVLGDKTFGVGAVQKVLELQDGSALILSVAKYFTPSGKAIQDGAVTPNILVAQNIEDVFVNEDGEPQDAPEEPKQPQEDVQLKRAIEVLKNGVKTAQMGAKPPKSEPEPVVERPMPPNIVPKN